MKTEGFHVVDPGLSDFCIWVTRRMMDCGYQRVRL